MPEPVCEVPVPEPTTPELPRRSIQAIIADLRQPLPEACVGHKTLKGQTLAFLTWPTVAAVLDHYAPGWQGTVARVDQVGTACAITYRLSIPCAEGTVVREATGQEEEGMDGYGDSTSNAEAMAFKRAAAKFGVGAWLYDRSGSLSALQSHLQGVQAPVVDLQAQRAQIAQLLKELGVPMTKAACAEAVQRLTGLELVQANYEAILTTLERRDGENDIPY